MNNKKRDRLRQSCALLEQALGIIQSVKDEEQACMDNISCNLQSTTRFATMEDAVDELESAIDCIGQTIDHIYNACS